MVKLTSLLALSALIIAPTTFASELWDFETRDISQEPELFGRELSGTEAAVFAREMEKLFARQQDTEYTDLARRDWGGLFKRGVSVLARDTDENSVRANKLHAPPMKHELVERDLDDELYIRDLIDAELFERFYDDLD